MKKKSLVLDQFPWYTHSFFLQTPNLIIHAYPLYTAPCTTDRPTIPSPSYEGSMMYEGPTYALPTCSHRWSSNPRQEPPPRHRYLPPNTKADGYPIDWSVTIHGRGLRLRATLLFGTPEISRRHRSWGRRSTALKRQFPTASTRWLLKWDNTHNAHYYYLWKRRRKESWTVCRAKMRRIVKVTRHPPPYL